MFLVGYTNQFAIRSVGPVVIAAHQALGLATGCVHHQIVAMTAHIMKCTNLASLASCDQHRGLADIQLLDEVAIFFRELFYPSHAEPRTLENALAFKLKVFR